MLCFRVDNIQNVLWSGISILTKPPILFGEIKCKAIPLQALTGPEGSRSLRLPDFKIIGT
jgi:hypothetical protein